jgi:4-amino-4-deoxy-L-arabinose transferase-like glycosyltransferase
MQLKPFIYRYGFILMMMLAAAMAFWHAGSHDLQEWDESRNGVNALEMLHRGDYINLYYHGQPDTWNAKPPLFIWLITLSYRLLGANELGLRLPAILCSLSFLAVLYRLAARYAGSVTALISCLILLGSKALLAAHIGITADFDAPLILFLTLSVSSFASYIDDQRPSGIWLAALATGLAFYSKGTAALVLAPGLVLYALMRRQFRMLLRPPALLAALLLLVIMASWPLLLSRYGAYPAETHYGSRSAWETLLLHDTWRRLTSTGFEQTYHPEPWFFFTTLDVRMNLWNYILYALLLLAIFYWIKYKINPLRALPGKQEQQLALLCACLILPLALVLSLATNKHDWYLAPVFGFIAILIAQGLQLCCSRYKPLRWLVAALLVFTIGRHWQQLHQWPAQLHSLLHPKRDWFRPGISIALSGAPRQHLSLYLYWLGLPVHRTDVEGPPPKGALLLQARHETVPVGYRLLGTSAQYQLSEPEDTNLR